jgi:hypothetical protein
MRNLAQALLVLPLLGAAAFAGQSAPDLTTTPSFALSAAPDLTSEVPAAQSSTARCLLDLGITPAELNGTPTDDTLTDDTLTPLTAASETVVVPEMAAPVPQAGSDDDGSDDGISIIALTAQPDQSLTTAAMRSGGGQVLATRSLGAICSAVMRLSAQRS